MSDGGVCRAAPDFNRVCWKESIFFAYQNYFFLLATDINPNPLYPISFKKIYLV